MELELSRRRILAACGGVAGSALVGKELIDRGTTNKHAEDTVSGWPMEPDRTQTTVACLDYRSGAAGIPRCCGSWCVRARSITPDFAYESCRGAIRCARGTVSAPWAWWIPRRGNRFFACGSAVHHLVFPARSPVRASGAVGRRGFIHHCTPPKLASRCRSRGLTVRRYISPGSPEPSDDERSCSRPSGKRSRRCFPRGSCRHIPRSHTVRRLTASLIPRC